MIRLMLIGYVIAACALSFHFGAAMTFYPEGVLYENAVLNYWIDFGVAQ